MRKFTLLICLALSMILSTESKAQWSNTGNNITSGTLRIGPSVPFTTKQLYVRANNTDHVALFENIDQFGNGMIISAYNDPLRVGGLNNPFGNYFIVKRDPSNSNFANVGINKSNPSSNFALDIQGSVQSFGYFTTSDERAKKNIRQEMGDYLNIYQVKTYQYTYKEDLSNKSHYGVMAQEMMNFYPDMVKGNEEDGYSVNYTEMIPLLIRAVQDQKQTIEGLQNELQELKTQIGENSEIADALGLEEDKMTIFPNPSTNVANIRLNGTKRGEVTLEVLNLNGEVVKTVANPSSETAAVDTSDLLKGVYFIRYKRDGKVLETKRLLIEK